MIRKSIGLALLAIALGAFVSAMAAGSATAAFDPFSPVPYYPYALLPATGLSMPDDGGTIPAWLVPVLAGVGIGAIAGLVAIRLRSYRQ